MNPIATKTAPATINQCGYSIAESIACDLLKRVLAFLPRRELACGG
jgi:hypothetical protein